MGYHICRSEINWLVIFCGKLDQIIDPKIQRHAGPHPFKGPWALPWALIHSVRMPYGRKASNASQASNASSRINLHIRHAKIYT